MLSVVTYLCFSSLYLRPLGIMEEHIVCLESLKLMLDFLQTHNGYIDELLETVTVSHHKDFVRLYPECV